MLSSRDDAEKAIGDTGENLAGRSLRISWAKSHTQNANLNRGGVSLAPEHIRCACVRSSSVKQCAYVRPCTGIGIAKTAIQQINIT